MVAGIAAEKFFEYRFGLGRIFEVILIDLGDVEQGLETLSTAGIFPAEKFVLADGGTQSAFIVESAPHFRQQVRDRTHAGVRLGRSRSAVINPAIRIDDALVFVAASFFGGEGVQRFPHALGGGKLCIGPGLRLASRLGGQHRKQQQDESRAQTPRASPYYRGRIVRRWCRSARRPGRRAVPELARAPGCSGCGSRKRSRRSTTP